MKNEYVSPQRVVMRKWAMQFRKESNNPVSPHITNLCLERAMSWRNGALFAENEVKKHTKKNET